MRSGRRPATLSPAVPPAGPAARRPSGRPVHSPGWALPLSSAGGGSPGSGPGAAGGAGSGPGGRGGGGCRARASPRGAAGLREAFRREPFVVRPLPNNGAALLKGAEPGVPPSPPRPTAEGSGRCRCFWGCLRNAAQGGRREAGAARGADAGGRGPARGSSPSRPAGRNKSGLLALKVFRNSCLFGSGYAFWKSR